MLRTKAFITKIWQNLSVPNKSALYKMKHWVESSKTANINCHHWKQSKLIFFKPWNLQLSWN